MACQGLVRHAVVEWPRLGSNNIQVGEAVKWWHVASIYSQAKETAHSHGSGSPKQILIRWVSILDGTCIACQGPYLVLA